MVLTTALARRRAFSRKSADVLRPLEEQIIRLALTVPPGKGLVSLARIMKQTRTSKNTAVELLMMLASLAQIFMPARITEQGPCSDHFP
jgi:hypothetical protein